MNEPRASQAYQSAFNTVADALAGKRIPPVQPQDSGEYNALVAQLQRIRNLRRRAALVMPVFQAAIAARDMHRAGFRYQSEGPQLDAWTGEQTRLETAVNELVRQIQALEAMRAGLGDSARFDPTWGNGGAIPS
jgi:hypothetical protein